MLPTSHPPPAALHTASTPLLAAFFAREPRPRLSRHRGQGLVEYGLILVLIAISTIGILSVLGSQTSDMFTEVECTMSGGTLRTDNGNQNSTRCIDANRGNNGGGGGGGGGGGRP